MLGRKIELKESPMAPMLGINTELKDSLTLPVLGRNTELTYVSQHTC